MPRPTARRNTPGSSSMPNKTILISGRDSCRSASQSSVALLLLKQSRRRSSDFAEAIAAIADSEQHVSPTMLISLRLRKRRTRVSRKRRFSATTYTLIGDKDCLALLCIGREPPPLSYTRFAAYCGLSILAGLAAVASIFDKAKFSNQLVRQSLFIGTYRVKEYPLFHNS